MSGSFGRERHREQMMDILAIWMFTEMEMSVILATKDQENCKDMIAKHVKQGT